MVEFWLTGRMQLRMYPPSTSLHFCSVEGGHIAKIYALAQACWGKWRRARGKNNQGWARQA